MVLIPKETRAAVIQSAENLRAGIQDLSIAYAGRRLPTVTISCGVASFPQDGNQIKDLLKNADDALYLAKAKGRNRVADTSQLSTAKTKLA